MSIVEDSSFEVDGARLNADRLHRAQESLREHGIPAALLFDPAFRPRRHPGVPHAGPRSRRTGPTARGNPAGDVDAGAHSGTRELATAHTDGSPPARASAWSHRAIRR